MTQSNGIDNLTFEEALQELDQIVSQLENEQLSLNESLSLFERGQILGSYCAKVLEEAELKVTRLTPGTVDIETSS
jgi:exodeoxyribonuclease VII small subunit